MTTSVLDDKVIKASGLTRGLKLLYRHTTIFYGIDYEASNLRLQNIDDVESYSSQRLSFLFGLKFSDNDYFCKVTTLGKATIDGIGDFSSPLGFEAGYHRRFTVEKVTKLMLFATYSRIDWGDFSDNLPGTDYGLKVQKLNIGVSIPFEIDLWNEF